MEKTEASTASSGAHGSATVFGLDPYSLKGKMLRNRHTGLENKVVDVCRGFGGKPVIYIAPGTSHDMWTLETIEEHYHAPESPNAPHEPRGANT